MFNNTNLFLLLIYLVCLLETKFIVAYNNMTESQQKNASYNIEEVPDSTAEMGEGPHWDIDTQSLYYVDINGGQVLRYDSKTNKIFKAQVENETLASFVIPVEGATNQFVIGSGRRVLIIDWDGVSSTAKVIRVLFTVQQDSSRYNGNRFNDAKCDPEGRLFAGTMRFIGDEMLVRVGAFFKYDGVKVGLVKSNVGISNGLTWNKQLNKFYYIDTADFDVKEYNYDFKTGEVDIAGGPRTVFDLHRLQDGKNILPDGMTIDSEGYLYVATFDGHSIYKVHPTTGQILQKIDMPCRQITSCAFGGPNLDVLYATSSSRTNLSRPAGSLFKITGLGVKGLPMTKAKILSLQTSYKIEEVPNSTAEMGEGPHWDVATESLYYVDINGGQVLRYDSKTNKVYKAQVENETLASFIIPVEGATNQFVIGSGRRVLIIDWDGVSPTAKVNRVLFTVEQDSSLYNGNRFNDAKCDPEGRLFAGTMRFIGNEMAVRVGAFFKYEDGKVEVVKRDVGISNGLTWNKQLNKFYYIDTADFDVKEYNYDVKTGQLDMSSGSRVLFDLHRLQDGKNILPDGMTIDSEGNLYVATFDGYSIYKVHSTTGEVLLKIDMPCRQITSCAFGGPNLDVLYATSSSRTDLPPPAGSLFKITGLGVKGLPMTKAKI